MRQTSVNFNYGGQSSSTIPLRHTTVNAPSTTYTTQSVAQNPVVYRQTTTPTRVNTFNTVVPAQNQEIKLKGFQSVNTVTPVQTTQKLESNNIVNYDNFPQAEAEEFTPGCCGKGSEGIVYQSHQKTQSFC